MVSLAFALMRRRIRTASNAVPGVTTGTLADVEEPEMYRLPRGPADPATAPGIAPKSVTRPVTWLMLLAGQVASVQFAGLTPVAPPVPLPFSSSPFTKVAN